MLGFFLSLDGSRELRFQSLALGAQALFHFLAKTLLLHVVIVPDLSRSLLRRYLRIAELFLNPACLGRDVLLRLCQLRFQSLPLLREARLRVRFGSAHAFDLLRCFTVFLLEPLILKPQPLLRFRAQLLHQGLGFFPLAGGVGLGLHQPGFELALLSLGSFELFAGTA